MANQTHEADPGERRRARIVHRIGVTVFALILFAALAGLMGKGPLSRVQTGDESAGLRVEHLRFIRYQGPVELKIAIRPGVATHGRVQLQLSRSFVEQVEIERMEPPPQSVTAGPAYFTYDIRAETNAPCDVTVRFVSSHFGRLGYEVGLAGGPKLKLEHFAFP